MDLEYKLCAQRIEFTDKVEEQTTEEKLLLLERRGGKRNFTKGKVKETLSP